MTTFFSFDTNSGKGRELFRLDEGLSPFLNQWDLSPDGLSIALLGPTVQRAIELRSVEGRLVRAHSHPEGCGRPTSLAWAADGRGLFLTAVCGGETRYALYHLDEGGRYTELLSSSYSYMRYLAASADGRHLAWSALELDNDAWLVELDGT